MASADSTSDRLSSIDLLRGVAAIAVAIFHGFDKGVSGSIHAAKDVHFFARLPITFGYAGVYLFFVISGFCIHLSWARGVAEGRPGTRNFASFWRRRLRRLYPAYAVALALGIFFTWRSGSTPSHFGLDIAAHVLLIHNFFPHSLYSINAVFWTLAIEEQLYLLYFVLLWMRGRYKWSTILIVCLAVRIGWHAFAWVAERNGLSLVVSGSAQATWFIWVLGALAVEAYYDLVKLPRWASSLPLAAVLAIGTAMLALLDRLHDGHGPFHMAALMFEQPGWGIASFITLNAVVRRETWLSARRHSFALRPWLWLGLVSYSLYLFHMYVYENVAWGVVGLGLALCAAGLGYLLFERPFIRRSRRI